MADLTTLANVKPWLNIASGTDDTLLSRLISASSDFIQTWLNRQIAQAAYTETRDGTGGTKLMFANYPVTAVSSVVIDGVTIPPSTSPSMPGYVFSQTVLSLRGSYVFTYDVQNVQIAYTAGFVTTPTEIEQACIELVSLRYRERSRIGQASKGLAGENVSYQALDLSDSVTSVLAQYRKVAPV